MDGAVRRLEREDAPVLAVDAHVIEARARGRERRAVFRDVGEHAARIPHLDDVVLAEPELRNERRARRERLVGERERHLLEVIVEELVRLPAHLEPRRAARREAGDAERREQRYEELAADRHASASSIT